MSTDLRPQAKTYDVLHRLGNARRDTGVAGFDHLHTNLIQQARDLDLFVNRKIDLGSLLALTQRSIQDLKHSFSFLTTDGH